MPTLKSVVSTDRIAAVYQQANNTGQLPEWAPAFALTHRISDGTGLNQANRFYVLESTIAASGTATFNLTSGLTDVFGNSLALTRVCEVWIEHLNESANTSTITIGGGSNPLWATLSVPLRKNGSFHVRDYSTTGLIAITTNTTITITNNSGTLVSSYRIVIVGSQ